MRTLILALGGALLVAPTVASAQTAAQNFSYSAPSGMFSEGTAKWQMFRFMQEDAERTARLRADEGLTTGSVQGSAISDTSVRRPGERGTRRGVVR